MILISLPPFPPFAPSLFSQDKHCLLELSLANVQGLLKQGVYPIVIHIQPKNKKYGRLKYGSLPQSPHANPDSN